MAGCRWETACFCGPSCCDTTPPIVQPGLKLVGADSWVDAADLNGATPSSEPALLQPPPVQPNPYPAWYDALSWLVGAQLPIGPQPQQQGFWCSSQVGQAPQHIHDAGVLKVGPPVLQPAGKGGGATSEGWFQKGGFWPS